MAKKILKIAAIVLLICLMGGWITALAFWESAKLVPVRNRPYAPISLTAEEKQVVDSLTRGIKDAGDIEIVREAALEVTADKLEFAAHNDIASGKANCVGYAQYCATVCEYILNAKKDVFQGRYTVSPVVGYITWGRFNMCNIARSIVPAKCKNFVKDHDFVAITCNEIMGSEFIDPCFYDYFGADLYTSNTSNY